MDDLTKYDVTKPNGIYIQPRPDDAVMVEYPAARVKLWLTPEGLATDVHFIPLPEPAADANKE